MEIRFSAWFCAAQNTVQVSLRSLRLQDFKANSSELNHMTINKHFLKLSQQCANNVLSYFKILRKNFLGIVKRMSVACVCICW